MFTSCTHFFLCLLSLFKWYLGRLYLALWFFFFLHPSVFSFKALISSILPNHIVWFNKLFSFQSRTVYTVSSSLILLFFYFSSASATSQFPAFCQNSLCSYYLLLDFLICSISLSSPFAISVTFMLTTSFFSAVYRVCSKSLTFGSP